MRIQILLNYYLPEFLRNFITKCYKFSLRIYYYLFGYPKQFGETSKAKRRRERENFFNQYCQGKGLDIGHGGDKILPNCDGWEFNRGDGQFLRGIKKEKYDFVYSSHYLEDIQFPNLALKNWWRILKPGGYLILYVPERDLYEKKKRLPSRWNPYHKHFFLVNNDDPPDTLGLIPLIERTLNNFKIIYAKLCYEGNTIKDPLRRSNGEFSIEIVIKKLR